MRMIDLSIVENLIISAIEMTETPDKMGEQSSIWDKVYQALEEIRNQSKEIKDE